MNEEEILGEIKEIFLHLAEQEPTPDEEIEARENLIDLFTRLVNIEAFQTHTNLINDILEKLNNWDTLELWFKEVEGLQKNIKLFLDVTVDIKAANEVKTIPSDVSDLDAEKAPLDVSEIVFQVTEQFKDEIGNLKTTIENLKKELAEKEVKLDKVVKQKTVKKIIPKREVKLTPPEIKIPSIKKPEVPPHIRVTPDLGEKAEKPISAQSDSESKLEKIQLEKTIGIDLSSEEDAGEITQPKQVSTQPRVTPIITEEPGIHTESKTPFEISPIPSEEKVEKFEEKELTKAPSESIDTKETAEKIPQLTPIPTETSETTPMIQEKPIIFPAPKEQSGPIPFSDEADIKEAGEKPVPKEATGPIPFTEVEEADVDEAGEKPILTPVIGKKPKITPISIEEIDTTEIKSSRTDLFNVFSSLGSKSSEESAPSPIPQKLSETKTEFEEKVEEGVTQPFFTSKPESSTPTPEISSFNSQQDLESLPQDKDTLYQELIALEGRRYSLEKNYKDLSNSYTSGDLDEFDFNKKSEPLKLQLDEISTRITNIRRIIANL
jgi:hypothetical protein